jgi:hypothetical protein
MRLKNLGAVFLFLYIKGTTTNYSRRSGLILDTYDQLIPWPGANSGLSKVWGQTLICEYSSLNMR